MIFTIPSRTLFFFLHIIYLLYYIFFLNVTLPGPVRGGGRGELLTKDKENDGATRAVNSCRKVCIERTRLRIEA